MHQSPTLAIARVMEFDGNPRKTGENMCFPMQKAFESNRWLSRTYQEKSNTCPFRFLADVFVLVRSVQTIGSREAIRRCSSRDRTSGGRHPRALQLRTISRHFSVKFFEFLLKFDVWNLTSQLLQPSLCSFVLSYLSCYSTLSNAENQYQLEIRLQPRTMASSFWRAVT